MTSSGQVGDDFRAFLTTRRARISPRQAGLSDFGERRRVPGLRREEVAMLAGISVEYYNRLERGNARGVSDEVVESLARALQLDDVERAHLIALVQAAASRSVETRRPVRTEHVRPALQQLLDAMADTAAFARTDRLEILATNHLCRALYAPVLDSTVSSRPVNLARFIFLDADARCFYRDWDAIAHAAVGSLRTAVGHDPADTALKDLIGEIARRSERFRTMWDSHDVQYYRAGVQRFHHPVVGDLDLDYDALEVAADPGLTIVAYTANPRSTARVALVELADSWMRSHTDY